MHQLQLGGRWILPGVPPGLMSFASVVPFRAAVVPWRAMHASSERPAVRWTLASALVRVRSGPPRRMLVVAALVAATALLAPAPYVASYASRDAVSPVGWDTPTFVWRTRVV